LFPLFGSAVIAELFLGKPLFGEPLSEGDHLATLLAATGLPRYMYKPCRAIV
jgi:hypothetical protein